MRFWIIVFLIVFASGIGVSTGVNAADMPVFIFASAAEGKSILTTRDEFILNMSPLDRSIRMRSEKPVSVEQFLQFVGSNVTPWEDDEKKKIEPIARSLEPKLALYARFLPSRVYLVRTTGNEEGGAAHVRENAIILPRTFSLDDPVGLFKLISHELFHIITHRNKKLANELYATIGFHPCPSFQFPEKIESRRITNPDSPSSKHCIQVKADKRKIIVVPVLYSNVDSFNHQHGEELFDYLQTAFLSVAKDNGVGKAPGVFNENQMKLYKEDELSGFFEQVGKNTDYTIHPEEILADNFMYLFLDVTEMESPQVVEKMRKIFETNRTGT